MQSKLEKIYLHLVREDAPGTTISLFRFFLTPLSWIYSACVFFRNFMYDLKIFNSYSLKTSFVISVGNIAIGGTGKTPFTIMLANEFIEKFSVAILSRGYKSLAEHGKEILILNQKKDLKCLPNDCGDEPYLLAENLPKALIFVGKNRRKSAEIAAQNGVDLIILDDGMQHRQLSRDLDVIMIDVKKPFFSNRVLPIGFLRENVKSLKRGQLIVLNNIQSSEQFDQMSHEIAKFTKALVVGTCAYVTGFKTMAGANLPNFFGKKVGVFCGISSPDNFVETLRKYGVEVVEKLFFEDHAFMDEKKIAAFSELCKKKNVEYLLCTEKDKVKIRDNINLSLPLAWVKIELRVQEGLLNWKEFVKKTTNLVNSKNTMCLKG